MRTAHLIAAATTILMGVSSAQAASWAITNYDVPGTTFTQLWGINNAGVIVGGDSLGGFIDNHGTITTVVQPGNTSTSLTGISSSGLVVGLGDSDSFFYSGGVFTPYSVAGADFTQIRSISANGRYAAGVYASADTGNTGFIYDTTTGTRTDITVPADAIVNVIQGVNDQGQVTGSLQGGLGLEYDLATNTTTTFAPSGNFLQYRLREINNEGVIGGWAQTTDFSLVGIIGTPGGGFDVLQVPGASSTYVYDINDVGQAVGFWADADGNAHGFLASSVPEPSSTALFLAGVLGVGFAARRRKGEAQAA